MFPGVGLAYMVIWRLNLLRNLVMLITIYVLDPCFIYQASVAVANLRLPEWAEPFAGMINLL